MCLGLVNDFHFVHGQVIASARDAKVPGYEQKEVEERRVVFEHGVQLECLPETPEVSDELHRLGMQVVVVIDPALGDDGHDRKVDERYL